MRRVSKIVLAVSAVVGTLGLNRSVNAASGAWTLTTGGAWNADANWTAPFPNAAGETATVNTNLGAAATLTLNQNITVGTLALADSASPYFGITVSSGGSGSNTLTFDSGAAGVNAVLRKAASGVAPDTNTFTEVIAAPLALSSNLAITAANGSSAGTIRIDGRITGVGTGIIATGTGNTGATGAAPHGTVNLTNTSSSYSGTTTLENGILQFSGSVLSGSNSALGNATSAIRVGTASSQTADAATLTLQASTSGPTSNSEISRPIDFSGINSFAGNNNNPNAQSLRYNADTTLTTGTRSNTLTVSGPITLSTARSTSFIANREGMTISFTGNITGGDASRNLRLGGFASNAGSELGGLATYRFSDVARDFQVANVYLLTGTVVIAGNVGLNDTAGPIGRNTGNAGFNLADGNGGNIISTAGRSIIRSVFLETPGTSFGVLGSNQRDLNPGGGFLSNDTDYGEASNTGGVNAVNGYRFGGVNNTGEVIFNSNMFPLRINVGGFRRSLSIAHNISFVAADGGIATFNGVLSGVSSSSTPDIAGAPGVTAQSSSFRLLINGFRNHPDLDTDGNGIPDAGGPAGTNANDIVGVPTNGVVKLNATGAGYLPTGTTEILGGTLLINGFHSRAASGTNAAVGGSILVNAGTTLGGYGTIRIGQAGSVVDVSGTVDPGDSTSTRTSTASILNIDKPLIFRAGSRLTLDINSDVASGSQSLAPRQDRLQLSATSSITIDPAATLNLRFGYEPPIGTFFLLVDQPSTGNPITGTFAGTPSGTVVHTSFGNVPVDVQIGYNVNADTANDIFGVSQSPVTRYALAGSGTWTQTGSWSNLSGTAYSPDSPNATVVLGTSIQTASVVALNSGVTASTLRFDSANAYTVAGAGSITIRTTSGTALLDVARGDHTIATPVTLAGNNTTAGSTTINVATNASLTLLGGVSTAVGSSAATIGGELFVAGGNSSLGVVSGAGSVSVTGGTLTVTRSRVAALDVSAGALVRIAQGTTVGATVSTVSQLSVTGGSLLDLTNGVLVVRNADVSALRTLVASWFNGGARNGPGIGSSIASSGAQTTLAVFSNFVAPGVPFYSSYGDVTLAPTDALIRYTYVGDTNLDGRVDGRDLANVIEGFSIGGTTWDRGDLNYDNVVNTADVGLVLAALNANLPALLGGPSSLPAPTGAVPEPSGLIAVAAAGLTLSRRRRARA